MNSNLAYTPYALGLMMNMSFKFQADKVLVYSLGEVNFPENCPVQKEVIHSFLL